MFSRGLNRLTPVEQNAFLVNMIEMENKHQKLYTNFCLNHFRPVQHISDKPTAFAEDESPDLRCYEELFKRCDMVPKERYPHIMTTSQEYGWHCPKPYNTDVKFHFPKKKSDLELYMQPKNTLNIV